MKFIIILVFLTSKAGYIASKAKFCAYPWDYGNTNCGTPSYRWYCNTVAHKCQKTKYLGCGGNANRFRTEQHCKSTCNHHTDCGNIMVENCDLKVDRGSTGVGCNQQIPRFYFDGRSCKAFSFNGCKGNGNNFKSYLSCICKCKSKTPGCTFGAGTSGGCMDDMDSGFCNGDFSRWQYNKTSGRCVNFRFGGCGGTGNKFDSKAHCESACVTHAGRTIAPQCPRCPACPSGAVRRPGVDARNCPLCDCDICLNCWDIATRALCPQHWYWKVHSIGCCGCHPCPVFRCQCQANTTPHSITDPATGCPGCKCCPSSECEAGCQNPEYILNRDGCLVCVCGCPPPQCESGCRQPRLYWNARNCLACTCDALCPPNRFNTGNLNGCNGCNLNCQAGTECKLVLECHFPNPCGLQPRCLPLSSG